MNLTDEQLKLITEVVSEQAIKTYKEDMEKREITKQDYRLHNIKLLLKNYRALVLHCEELMDELEEFNETSIQELDIETISLESIESIKRSKRKSISMVYFIQGKMEAYRRSCNENELKYYQVLEKRYLSKQKYTISQIAELENIDERTVHRYLKKAIEDLPVIFFGVSAISFAN
ncbi:hypothetical protein [Oceanobacillus sojae]|uniref:Helix-turn-helix type 11 domain-containing protein n=1 Tax=Oceanobacillus sojae TaxID=582851 RepID=A0A511ZHN8_9BACI|nr:hypothetical protein [Oceanobacillus sojae]GEN86941.1 hypothetical protein OSO01_16800 [Oceanobacillus sojae]